MPCIFCIAVFALIAGAITAQHLDRIEQQLAAKAADQKVHRVVDTESVARFELKVRLGTREIPVAVTVIKEFNRVRIQILTHDLTDEQIRQIEDELAAAMQADIVDRVDPTEEHDHEHEHDEAIAEEKAQEIPNSQPRRQASTQDRKT